MNSKNPPGYLLPPVAVMDVAALATTGDLTCTLPNWKKNDAPPLIYMHHEAAAQTTPPLGVGDRFLGRLAQHPDGHYLTHPIKIIGKSKRRHIGIFKQHSSGGIVTPVTRKSNHDVLIDQKHTLGAQDGDLVWVEHITQRSQRASKKGRIYQIVEQMDAAHPYCSIALAQHAIPTSFPEDVLRSLAQLATPNAAHREDMTTTPLITIDPVDSKDHDDAIFAAPDTAQDNIGGWRLIVAIADVAYFVRAGSALDKEAAKRGNSVYLPGHVIPMLPEHLSNNLCSLQKDAVRPALAVDIRIAADGTKLSHRFCRTMIKIHANLSYEDAQCAATGKPPDALDPDFIKQTITPLWGAYQALSDARHRRSPLALSLPEKRVELDASGHVEKISLHMALDTHRLVEEFMVLANVCAAETLQHANIPFIYRVHDKPDKEKIESVRQYLARMGYTLSRPQQFQPRNLNAVLAKAEENQHTQMISQVILRAQCQAIYDTENLGHFGLHLPNYTHFTSPIRRYTDLTIHRALIKTCQLGDGGHLAERDTLREVAAHTSRTERRAMVAERDSTDRFLAAFLSPHIGKKFSGYISGVTRFGLFVALDDTGANGFIPIRGMHTDYLWHDVQQSRLVEETTGATYAVGMAVNVRLVNAVPLQGSLQFDMLTAPLPPAKGQKPTRPTKRRNRIKRRHA